MSPRSECAAVAHRAVSAASSARLRGSFTPTFGVHAESTHADSLLLHRSELASRHVYHVQGEALVHSVVRRQWCSCETGIVLLMTYALARFLLLLLLMGLSALLGGIHVLQLLAESGYVAEGIFRGVVAVIMACGAAGCAALVVLALLDVWLYSDLLLHGLRTLLGWRSTSCEADAMHWQLDQRAPNTWRQWIIPSSTLAGLAAVCVAISLTSAPTPDHILMGVGAAYCVGYVALLVWMMGRKVWLQMIMPPDDALAGPEKPAPSPASSARACGSAVRCGRLHCCQSMLLSPVYPQEVAVPSTWLLDTPFPGQRARFPAAAMRQGVLLYTLGASLNTGALVLAWVGLLLLGIYQGAFIFWLVLAVLTVFLSVHVGLSRAQQHCVLVHKQLRHAEPGPLASGMRDVPNAYVWHVHTWRDAVRGCARSSARGTRGLVGRCCPRPVAQWAPTVLLGTALLVLLILVGVVFTASVILPVLLFGVLPVAIALLFALEKLPTEVPLEQAPAAPRAEVELVTRAHSASPLAIRPAVSTRAADEETAGPSGAAAAAAAATEEDPLRSEAAPLLTALQQRQVLLARSQQLCLSTMCWLVLAMLVLGVILLAAFGVMLDNVDAGPSSTAATFTARRTQVTSAHYQPPLYAFCDADVVPGLSYLDLALLSRSAYKNDPAAFLHDSAFRHNLSTLTITPQQRLTPRYMLVELSSFNLTVVVIRGTKSGADALADALLWGDAALLQAAKHVLAPVFAWSSQQSDQWLVSQGAAGKSWMTRGIRDEALNPDTFYMPIVRQVRDLAQRRAVVVTGHSLGGGVSGIVAAVAKVPGVAFSGPGVALLADMLSSETGTPITASDIDRWVRNVVPLRDPVPWVGGQSTGTYHIRCPARLPVAPTCHSIGRTIETIRAGCAGTDDA